MCVSLCVCVCVNGAPVHAGPVSWGLGEPRLCLTMGAGSEGALWARLSAACLSTVSPLMSGWQFTWREDGGPGLEPRPLLHQSVLVITSVLPSGSHSVLLCYFSLVCFLMEQMFTECLR